MNKDQALNTFWNSFDIPAYDQYSVPDRSSFPYITYQATTDSLGNVLNLSASLWYRETGWKNISDKADEIAKAIGYSYNKTKIDDGYMVIYKGVPFASRMNDPSDDLIKRIVLNISVEFLTKD